MTRGSLAGHLSCASLTRPLAEERQKTIIIVDRVCALTTRTMEATVAQPTVMRLMCNIVANRVAKRVQEQCFHQCGGDGPSKLSAFPLTFALGSVVPDLLI